VAESTDQGAAGYDVIIVGNGSLGLSLGLCLARRGASVAVVGPTHRRGAASSAAGAMIGVFGEVTRALLSNEYGRTKLSWAYEASKLWPEWIDQLPASEGDAPIKTADGTVVMLNAVGSGALDSRNFQAIREALVEYGEKFEEIEPEEIGWLDPEQNARPLRAMFLPHEGAVDAPELLRRLEQGIRQQGGDLVADTVAGLSREGDRITGVVLASETRLSADHVVLAAGSASQHVLDTVPGLAVRIPRLVSGYGLSVLVDTEDSKSPDAVLRTPNRAFACGLHLVPRGGGQVYIGATNITSPFPRETPLLADVLFLLTCATRQLNRNLAEGGMRAVQVGNRPFALDGMPLLGAAGLDGLWLMTGTYRDGLTLSPLLAREMSALILGEVPSIELAMFQPVRPPIQPATRAEIVESTVLNALAAGYESEWQLPSEWPISIERYLRRAFGERAETLDPDFTPPPELLAASGNHPQIADALRSYYAASRS
jgi:glycine oxidase